MHRLLGLCHAISRSSSATCMRMYSTNLRSFCLAKWVTRRISSRTIDVPERREVVGGFHETVHAVIHRDEPHTVAGEDQFGVIQLRIKKSINPLTLQRTFSRQMRGYG